MEDFIETTGRGIWTFLKTAFRYLLVELFFYFVGRIFLFIVTFGRFPPAGRAKEYDGIFELTGFLVFLCAIAIFALYKYSYSC